MTSTDDRKMFAPMRHREAAVSPEAKVFSILAGYEAGAIAPNLAEALVTGGLAIGTRALVTKRIGEMLDSMEQAGRVERLPDGRYRAVRSHVEGARK